MPVLKSINPYDPTRVINHPQLSDLELTVKLGRANSAYKNFSGWDMSLRESAMKKNCWAAREGQRG